MRFKYLALIALFCLAGCLVACNDSSASQLNANWQYTFAPAGSQGAACSATQTTNCIPSFTVEDISNAQDPVPEATVAAPALSVTATIATPTYGPHIYGVVANVVNANGSTSSSPVSSPITVTITAPAPTGFAITVI